MNEICPCLNRNARPNNNQLITYSQRVSYLLRILQYPVNNTHNIAAFARVIVVSLINIEKLKRIPTFLDLEWEKFCNCCFFQTLLKH